LQYTRNGNPVVPFDSLAVRFALSLAQVTVRVMNADSTIAIPNAQVDLYGVWNYLSVTDADGYAVFSNMKTGNYRLRAFANGYQATTTAQFAIANTDTLNRILALTNQTITPNAPTNLVATGGQNEQIFLRWNRPAAAVDEPGLLSERTALIDVLSRIPSHNERRIRYERRLQEIEHDLSRIEYERNRNATDALFGYNIYRITGTDTALVGYRNLPTDTTYTDVGLTNGVLYRHYVRAVYDEGLSDVSNVTGVYPRPFGMYLSETLPSFQWVDIANRGSAAVYGDDEISAPIPLPFRFPFFGEYWDTLQISTNGFVARSLTVDDADLRFCNGIPNPVLPNNLIAGYWTDLVASRDSIRCWYDSTNNRFIVSVLSAQFYGAPLTSVSFQYVLQTNGEIYLNFRRVVPPQFSTEQTNGVENRFGTDGFGYTYRGILETINNRTYHVYPSLSFCNVLGIVSDSTTGAPLSAQVALNYNLSYPIRRMTQTNPANGSYSFVNVNALTGSTYSLEVSSPGYQTRTVQFQVTPDTVITRNVRLLQVGNLPPANCTAIANFDDRVRLTWDPPGTTGTDETDILTGFKVYRDAVLRATLPSTALSYDDSIGSNGENVAHTYRVSATYSTAPTEVFATDITGVRFNMQPASPVNLSAIAEGDSVIRLAWAAPTTNRDGTPLVDGTSFRIYRNSALLTTIPFAQTSYNDRNVDTLHTYTYTVNAIDEVPNASNPSNPAFASFRNPYQTTTYYWLNTPGATTLPFTIDQAQKVPLGFPYNFFGTVFDSVTISSNGFLSFTDEQWWPRDCPGFPNQTAPNAVIAPLWGELDCSQGTVSYASPMNRMFIVSFENILFRTTRDTAGSFQVRIDSVGAITFAYRTAPRNPLYGIGIEDASGITGYQLNLNGNGAFTPTTQSSVAFFQTTTGTGTLSGSVVRPNGTPVSNVAIAINDTWNTTTNAAGQYTMQLPVGNWRVKISRPCFYPDSIIRNTVSIATGQTTTIRDTLGQGDLVANPVSFEITGNRGQVVTRPLTLQNSGDARLTWNAEIRYRSALDGVSATLPRDPITPPAADQIWGPDAFGYRAYDITEPEVPELLFWPDITSTGTTVVAGDDQGVMCDMDGFVFNYYGVNFSRLFVSTNGIVKFTEVTTGTGYNVNSQLPANLAFNALMPLWDDLEATVYKQYYPANNVFVLQWDGNRYPNATDTVQFQIVFYGNERMFLFGYNRIHSASVSATVGIQYNAGANNFFLPIYYGAQPGQGIPTNMNSWGIVFYA
ncbi:MAG: carboxypeptidase-like regulatory domain-containing protein, partial [bacterium]|nr:carboxypeptidase-like regulatory domain-containing protein [bacterium]